MILYVQPIESGVLLVGARCHWSPEAVEKNAVIYDWHGRQVRRFALGDGIAAVCTTPDGTIWTSYFDEGIFGNYGWNYPGPTPIMLQGGHGNIEFRNIRVRPIPTKL